MIEEQKEGVKSTVNAQNSIYLMADAAVLQTQEKIEEMKQEVKIERLEIEEERQNLEISKSEFE